MKKLHMAKAMATKELVSEAASTLVAEGIEPSIVTVQSRIGGGSYTTIKRHLDEWSKEQALSAKQAIETPAFVVDRSAELGRELWVLAMREASKETQAVKDASESKLQAITKELAFAQSEITRMEDDAEDSAKTLAEALSNLIQLRNALQEAQAQAARVPDMQTRMTECQSELSAVREEAKTHAVNAGRLAGEAESLRTQLHDITAALVALKSETPKKDRP